MKKQSILGSFPLLFSLLTVFGLLPFQKIFSQTYYATTGPELMQITINNGTCSYSSVGALSPFVVNIAACPDGSLYGAVGGDIYEYDPSNAQGTWVFNDNSFINLVNITCAGGGILYATTFQSDLIYEINVNTETVTPLGATGLGPGGGLTFFNGILYMSTASGGLVEVNLANPSNSTLLFELGNHYVNGLSVFGCNLLGGSMFFPYGLSSINLSDGTETLLCDLPFPIQGLTSLDEFQPPPPCPITLDLDGDDSSGALNADFNAPEYDCLTQSGLPVADMDVEIEADNLIQEMTISLAGVLNAPFEMLVLNSANNISITGSGTTSITLTSNGSALINDFIDALTSIIYQNTAAALIPGIRQVNVSFTTASGGISNTATAFIEVIQLPSVAVNLGNDVQICQGELVVLNAGFPGATYLWSTQATTQTITVNNPGPYSVTVSNGIDCPGSDEVLVEMLPNYEVTLNGPTSTCEGEPVLLNINTNAPSPITVDISDSNGEQYTFSLLGSFPFMVQLSQTTTFTIEGVSSNVPLCPLNQGGPMTVQVFQDAPVTYQDAFICEGDSIFLEGAWQNVNGIYTDEFFTIHGCDSMVTTTLFIVAATSTNLNQTTCEPTEVGTVTNVYQNQNGCDSTVIITTTLSLGDSTLLTSTTCNANEAGTFTQILTNTSGCDSVVISTISLLPGDTVHVSGTTCDENMVGVFTNILTGQNGCDSIVIENISLLPGDTAYISGTTCDAALVGVFTNIFTRQNGCDSVVISDIALLPGDTVLLFDTSCDPANAGVFTQNLANQAGCDSVVVTTVAYAEADTTILSGNTCNPSGAGIFVQTFTTPNGCDSTVIENISLSPSDTVYVFGTNCDENMAGIFQQVYSNQYGCDSLIISTVTYIPADTVIISGITCDAATAGVSTHVFTNQYGCDSLVIENMSLSPSDTVYVFDTSCDAANTGTFQQIFANQYGCDSLVIENMSLSPSDTVYVFDTSCDAANTGTFQQIFTNQYGCDSTVILSVSFAESDTTLLASTTCDPAAAGTFWQNLTSADGCDSAVLTMVTWLPSDSVSLSGTTCDPAQAGVFTQNLSNQNGCDSVVTTTVSLLPASETFLTTTTCDPSQAGVFVQNLTGQNSCDSTVTTAVALLPGSETFLNSTTCDPSQAGVFTQILTGQDGCDSTVVETVALLASDTTFLASATCDASQAGVMASVFTNQSGCDSVVVEEVTWTPPPVLALGVSDFNGWAISCPGGADGSIVASATGAAPLGFAWSNGSAVPQIAGLSAGNYSLTVTDANGCTATAGATLGAPPALQVSFVVNNLDCFEEDSGAIFVQAGGGAPPLRYSLDGLNFQDANAFENLGAGAYQVTVMDANGCGATELILINAPVPVEVDLGEDLTIELGGGAELQAMVNVPLDSLADMVWTGLDPSAECPACPQQAVFPLVTTSYSVAVVGNNGCRGEDEVRVFVDRRKHVYVPNAFSPNGDGANDVFQVFAKPGTVKSILSFLVFDRWGESVWQYFNFLPDDPAHGWNGEHKGEAMGPQVFVWFAEVEFTDGQVELLEGDVTLLR